jgi:hypothetical protein
MVPIHGVCPSCGYCGTCGRRNDSGWPYKGPTWQKDTLSGNSPPEVQITNFKTWVPGDDPEFHLRYTDEKGHDHGD